MPPKRKKTAPATRRFSSSPAAGKQATSPKVHNEASVAKKTKVADVGKEDVELLSPRPRVVSIKNAKAADGKDKPEEGKVVGLSSPAGNRGRAVNGKEKQNDEMALPEPKKSKKVKEDVVEDKGSLPTASNHVTRTIIIEACTQCKSFKERTDKVKKGLEIAIPGIAVEINPQKPRRGYFEIREEKTEVVLSLPRMNRPFTLMKQLNMDELVKDLIKSTFFFWLKKTSEMRAIISSYVGFEAHRVTRLLFFFSLCLLYSINVVEATVRHLKWEIKYEYKSPDCFKKLGITINGLSPGPTITATQGDTLVVQATNSLITENTAIHWHGIRQRGTPWSDGTQGITQCPIQPGETFIYRFVVDRAGTYIYHAHYEMQRSAGLHGLIRVLVPEATTEPYTYDEDRSIIVNDWWHKSAIEQSTGLLSLNFGWVGEPQSLLINGRGRYNCSLAGTTDVCNMTSPECSPSVLTMVPGKTYLFRIASLASLSALNLEIEGHNMTIVESDGHYVNPVTLKNLNIYSGETYSVIVKADQDPSRNYWIGLNVVSRKPATPTGTAILNYYPNHPLKPPPTSPPLGPLWNDTLYRFNQSKLIKSHPNYIEAPPPISNRLIILLNTQNKINGYTRWSVNNVSFILPTTPYLIAIKENLRHVFNETPAPDTYDYKNYDIYSASENPNATLGDSIHRLEYNSTVDVILQNANTLSINNSETHPWHLHGHDFWVMGYGLGKFDPQDDPKNYNLVNPIQKNTVPVHPYGWTALRFRADNPGVWAFHCHLEAHFFIGMGIVIEEGVERLGKLPKSIMGCGQSKSLGRS